MKCKIEPGPAQSAGLELKVPRRVRARPGVPQAAMRQEPYCSKPKWTCHCSFFKLVQQMVAWEEAIEQVP